MIVRSNGTVTYVGKDIAYQLWKFGLLGKDFYYRPLPDLCRRPRPVGRPPTSRSRCRRTQFGHGTQVYNVIDARQSYLQDVVVAGLRALGYDAAGGPIRSISPTRWWRSRRAAASTWAFELSEEDRKRPYVEVSGRKGLGVKADDLIDKLIEKALEEVTSRHPDDAGGEAIGAWPRRSPSAALRYFLLKFTRNTVIAFDLQEALSFEGETGPYVQYAAVRARNILRKLEERGEQLPDFARGARVRRRMARQLAVRGFLADAAGGFESGFGGGERGPVGRAGARGAVRLPTGAGVQQLLSEVLDHSRTGSREERCSCCG